MKGNGEILIAYHPQIFLVLSGPLLCQWPSILFGCLRRPASIIWRKENSCAWCCIHALWTLKSGSVCIKKSSLCLQNTSKISSQGNHYLSHSQSQDLCRYQTKYLPDICPAQILHNSNNPVGSHHTQSEMPKCSVCPFFSFCCVLVVACFMLYFDFFVSVHNKLRYIYIFLLFGRLYHCKQYLLAFTKALL